MNSKASLAMKINGDYIDIDDAEALYQQLGDFLGKNTDARTSSFTDRPYAVPATSLVPYIPSEQVPYSFEEMADLGSTAIKAAESAIDLNDSVLLNILRSYVNLEDLMSKGTEEKKAAYVFRVATMIMGAVIQARSPI